MTGDGKTKARDAIIRIIKYKLDQYLKDQNADFAINPSEKEINQDYEQNYDINTLALKLKNKEPISGITFDAKDGIMISTFLKQL